MTYRQKYCDAMEADRDRGDGAFIQEEEVEGEDEVGEGKEDLLGTVLTVLSIILSAGCSRRSEEEEAALLEDVLPRLQRVALAAQTDPRQHVRSHAQRASDLALLVLQRRWRSSGAARSEATVTAEMGRGKTHFSEVVQRLQSSCSRRAEKHPEPVEVALDLHSVVDLLRAMETEKTVSPTFPLPLP